MTSEAEQTPPTDEKVKAWFGRRFGREFTPTEEQKAWVKENWGRENVLPCDSSSPALNLLPVAATNSRRSFVCVRHLGQPESSRESTLYLLFITRVEVTCPNC